MGAAKAALISFITAGKRQFPSPCVRHYVREKVEARMRMYMTSDETENDSVFTHSFYKSKNSEGTGDNSEGPVPAALGAVQLDPHTTPRAVRPAVA